MTGAENKQGNIQKEGDRADRQAGGMVDQLTDTGEAAGRHIVGNQEHVVGHGNNENTQTHLPPHDDLLTNRLGQTRALLKNYAGCIIPHPAKGIKWFL